MDQNLDTYFKIGSALVAIIIWFVRLESKVMYMENRMNNVEEGHSELKEKVHDQLTTIKESLAKIEGFLQAKNND
jgi:hypothetical protein